MRASTFLIILFLVAFGLSSSADAGGFKVVGKTMDEMELQFDSTGIDRSTAEGTAKGFLDVFASMRSKPQFRLVVGEIEFNTSKQYLGDLLSQKAFGSLFGQSSKRIEKMKKSLASVKMTMSISLGKEEVDKTGHLHFPYTVTTEVSGECPSCGGKGYHGTVSMRAGAKKPETHKTPCPRCKGKQGNVEGYPRWKNCPCQGRGSLLCGGIV